MKDWIGNSNSVWKSLGASNHTDEERGDHDYYATSPDALEMLVPNYPLHKKIWECACGEGHLSKWLVEHGHDVLSTDLIDRGYGIDGIDFLKVGTNDLFNKNYFKDTLGAWYSKDNPNLSEPFDILTNPPYKFSTEFVLHALDLIPEDGHVIMFLKTSFLEGLERRKRIYDVNPPIIVYQFSGRMVCAKNGDFAAMKDIGSAIPYSWIIWSKHNKEMKTLLKWL